MTPNFLRAAALALTTLFSTTSWSTSTPPPPAHPSPQPVSAHGGHGGAGGSADASATAGAAAGASATTGPVTATGGAATTGASTSSTGPVTAGGASLQDNSTSTNRTQLWVFPAPVAGSQAAINGCVVAANKLGAIGWNFASGSTPVILSERHCVLMTLAAAAQDSCRYETAALIRDMLAEEVLGDRLQGRTLPAPPPGTTNLDPLACAEMKRPPMPPQPAAPVQMTIRAEGGTAFSSADVAPAQAPARPPKGKPQPPCPTGQTQQCVAPNATR